MFITRRASSFLARSNAPTNNNISRSVFSKRKLREKCNLQRFGAVILRGKASDLKPVAEFEFSNLVEMLQKTCILNKDKYAFGTLVGKAYQWITYEQFGREVEKFRNVLHHHNIGVNDKIAVISNNRVEWAVAAYAVNSLGGQIVPMYEAQLEKDWRYIINDSDAKMILVANEKIYEKTKGYINNVGKVESILTFDASDEYLHSYKRWMSLAEKEIPVPPIVPRPSDIASIIYTSGTTGNPKGVELSHENIVSNLHGLKEIWKNELYSNRSLAFLPWAHVFGQTAELHSLLAAGSAMGIVSTREQILESFDMIKPTMMLSVPALFNRVYDGVMKKILDGSPLKQKLFALAMKNSREYNRLKEFGKTPGAWLQFKQSIFDKLVFSKIRDRFGGNLRWMASGGAAVNLKVLEFFEDIGIPVCEGYGLTETSPVITAGANNWETRRLGCVGVPLPGMSVKILDPETKAEMAPDVDGEVCCSGKSVMVGYRNNNKANEEVFFYLDGKRYFRTGDLGRMVDGKFLKITGRIKEQFKLENGKYVVPALLEDYISRSRFIAQALLYGDNKPFTILLIVPDMLELRAWYQKTVGQSDDDETIMKNVAVQDLMSREIEQASYPMKNYERPLRWGHTLEAFSQDNQMMTPKMSLRRNNILKHYSQFISDITEGKAGIAVHAQASSESVGKS